MLDIIVATLSDGSTIEDWSLDSGHDRTWCFNPCASTIQTRFRHPPVLLSKIVFFDCVQPCIQNAFLN